ncbi:MAG: sigma 54-interacting transcriptional regulator [Planctomycetaceae bacterium]|nr:sigma 54-interacting transcriptional regulator [Planctomycetaceae bacterium]
MGGNLPAPGAIVGREREIAELVALLGKPEPRLITILGPGGIGKTRLSIEAGSRAREGFPAGVWFCDLSLARTFEGICHAVGETLDISLTTGDPAGQIGFAIAGRMERANGSMLLILDNFEQCVEHAQSTIARWLTLAPRARFIVTSRFLLKTPGEHEYILQPLKLPPKKRTEAAKKMLSRQMSELESYPSVHLFVARAREYVASFRVTEENIEAIAQICVRLDGLPLAIELAAARVRVLTPAQILERLKERFDLLRNMRGDAVDRQATMRAAIDWSWELLAEHERSALAQLSVFRGSFPVDGVEAVVDLGGRSALDALDGLIEKSFVRSEERSGERRFSMYETIREYAGEKLKRAECGVRSPELKEEKTLLPSSSELRTPHSAPRTLQRWRSWLLTTSRKAWDGLRESEGDRAFRSLARESEGLISIALSDDASPEDAGWAAVMAALVLYRHGPATMIAPMVERCLARFGVSVAGDISLDDLDLSGRDEVVHRLIGMRALALCADNPRRAVEMIDLIPQQSPFIFDAYVILFTAYQRLQDADGAIECVQKLNLMKNLTPRQRLHVDVLASSAREMRGKAKETGRDLERVVAEARMLDDPRIEGMALNGLARVYELEGNLDLALRTYERAVEVHRGTGHRNNRAAAQGSMAHLMARTGRLDEALKIAEEAYAVDLETGNRFGQCHRGIVLSALHCALGRLDEASAMAEKTLILTRSVSYAAGTYLALGMLGVVWLKRGLGAELAGQPSGDGGAFALARARELLTQASEISAHAGFVYPDIAFALARCEEALGNAGPARSTAKKGLDALKRAKDKTPALYEPDYSMAIEHGERIAAGLPPVEGNVSTAGDSLIGSSKAMAMLRSLIGKVAGSNVDVLVLGETGTGKEVIARAIHAKSKRARKRFVAINCGAMPAQLLESELFGHEKGAFTGAGERKIGLMEYASGGTLFLDEIGEMPLDMQVKLLRALQERKIRRVGGTAEIAIDVRIIAATVRDLQTLAKQGKFREDLFYRIDVMRVDVPPLRERRGDVIELAEHFLALFEEEFGGDRYRLNDDAERKLLEWRWPGNVRELANAIRHAMALATSGEIGAEHLPDWNATSRLSSFDTESAGPALAAAASERNMLVELLSEHRGNVTAATKASGIDRRTFYRMLERHGLKSADYRKSRR